LREIVFSGIYMFYNYALPLSLDRLCVWWGCIHIIY